VLVFLDGTGKRVAYARQLRSERDALLLNEFVAQRQYAMSAFARYAGQNFDSRNAGRVVPEARVSVGLEPIDDRPRLRDVLAQQHERLSGDALKKLLAGKRMHKENQDWFLVLDLKPGNMLAATGSRKDGRNRMQGPGKWYVTKKGKLCLELSAGGVRAQRRGTLDEKLLQTRRGSGVLELACEAHRAARELGVAPVERFEDRLCGPLAEGDEDAREPLSSPGVRLHVDRVQELARHGLAPVE